MKTTRKLLALLLTLILFVGIFAGCGKKPEEEATTTTPETTEAESTTETPTEAPTAAPTTTTTSPQTTKAPSTTKRASAPPATQAPAPTQPPATTKVQVTDGKLSVYSGLGVANDAEYQALVNQVANYKCKWCGNHNCPSIEYHKDRLGNYTTYGVFPERCPEWSNGNVRCSICGKILTSDFNKVLSDPDTYCIGNHSG